MRADLCIVGAGAAGLTLAHAMRDRGLWVVTLDSGPVEEPAGRRSGGLAVRVGLRDAGHIHEAAVSLS